ncbi:uncharacterized protein LOC111888918 [Lactuca sativa]|uniref:uncharacterized protein LOC111888918 n=1 Tax=Lactuca sativa TaxID=4236 RepID=UPI000CD8F94D|nr:uncharacterized protein LOC111888918 [Lactuca sativa]
MKGSNIVAYIAKFSDLVALCPGVVPTEGKKVEIMNAGESSQPQKPNDTPNAQGSPMMTMSVNHAEKPEKFSGLNFKRWQQKMVLNYVLNGLVDLLYNVYCVTKTTKELWDSLDKKYKTEEVGTKKFLVALFLDYKMVDGKIKGKGSNFGAKGGTLKKTFQGTCHNYDRRGHRASNCKPPKKANEANVVEKITNDVSVIDLVPVISEVNLVESNPRERWIDMGATLHVCLNREWFRSFMVVENCDKLFIGNSATSYIQGVGKIVSKMTSRRDLTLNDVLYVPEIHKNLVLG